MRNCENYCFKELIYYVSLENDSFTDSWTNLSISKSGIRPENSRAILNSNIPICPQSFSHRILLIITIFETLTLVNILFKRYRVFSGQAKVFNLRVRWFLTRDLKSVNIEAVACAEKIMSLSNWSSNTATF